MFSIAILIFLENMQYVKRLRKVGVKIVGKFALWSTAANFARISESADLRNKMAESSMAVMAQLQLDGLYLLWMWPGCPWVN